MPRPVDSSLRTSLLSLLLLVVALTLPLWLAVAAAPAPDAAKRTGYTTRFDKIDLERILSSRRLVANYVDCLLGRKRCTPEGAELKRVLPDALATRCARCSERQREAAVRAIRLLRQRYPDLWAPLQLKWDPSGEHTRRLEQATARRASSARAGRALPTATNGPAALTATSKAAAPSSATRTNSAIFADTMHDTPVTPAVEFMPYAATLASTARTNSASPAAAAKRNVPATPAGLISSNVAIPTSAARTNSTIPASHALLHSPVAASVAATELRTSSVVPTVPSPGPVSVTTPNPAANASTAKNSAPARPIPVDPSAVAPSTETNLEVAHATATPAGGRLRPCGEAQRRDPRRRILLSSRPIHPRLRDGGPSSLRHHQAFPKYPPPHLFFPIDPFSTADLREARRHHDRHSRRERLLVHRH